MKLNFKMPDTLKPYYKKELDIFREAVYYKDFTKAWSHIERAHIIGQRYPIEHTETHWKMMRLGIKSYDMKEVLGQIMRLIFGAPLSFVNKIPVGNVGSTRVSMIKPQETPEDIQFMFSQLEK